MFIVNLPPRFSLERVRASMRDVWLDPPNLGDCANLLFPLHREEIIRVKLSLRISADSEGIPSKQSLEMSLSEGKGCWRELAGVIVILF